MMVCIRAIIKMQNQNQTISNNQPPLPPKVAPAAPKPAPIVGSAGGAKPAVATPQDTFVRKIVEKIKSSENILVALSKDPTVDEMAAAIGLTLFLDGLQKHATAIYSGKTPDALHFLQPEGTFEANTDSLRDFIIALNKEKADHLRYKLDGDYVKVYITPYKTVIHESDLEFSQGDFNVSLVLALGVPSPEDLDDALSEYGRIMHDATTVNITIDAGGKFAEIEWNDPEASSVSEMVLRVIEGVQGKDARIDKEVATALLTGIVAATNRFSNDRTNSDTMQIAAKLMSMGADQQLIAAHVMDGKVEVATGASQPIVRKPVDDGNLLVGKDYQPKPDPVSPTVPVEQPAPTSATEGAVPDLLAQPTRESQAAAMAAAKAAVKDAVSEAAGSAAAAGATGVGMVEAGRKMKTINPKPGQAESVAAAAAVPSAQTPVVPVNPAAGQSTVAPQWNMSGGPSINPPSSEMTAPKNYAEMLEQALHEPVPGASMMNIPGTQAAMPQGVPEVANPVVETPAANPMGQVAEPGANEPVLNPDGIVLPPPPAPNVGNNVMPPAMSDVVPDPNMAANLAAAVQIQEGVVEQPQPQAAPAQAAPAEPGAFQIPGMQG